MAFRRMHHQLLLLLNCLELSNSLLFNYPVHVIGKIICGSRRRIYRHREARPRGQVTRAARFVEFLRLCLPGSLG